jgi:hypothetical protein
MRGAKISAANSEISRSVWGVAGDLTSRNIFTWKRTTGLIIEALSSFVALERYVLVSGVKGFKVCVNERNEGVPIPGNNSDPE